MRRVAALIATLLGLVSVYLLTWPVPIDPVSWDAPTDAGLVVPFEPNDRLQAVQLVELGEHAGPEDLVFGFDGLLYAPTEHGEIISFHADGSDLRVFATPGGRPLGLDFSGGFLYVANAYRGLQRIRADGRVIDVVNEFNGQPIAYADDVAVAADGKVYFTDASSKFGAEAHGGTYPASLLDILEHGGHGRVFRYDPFANETTLIMADLNFANGIAVSEDQQYLLVNETGSYRVWRHWLAGDKAGTSEVLLDNLPGFPDNINNGLQGRFWIGLVAPRNDLVDRFSDSPLVRKMMQRLPAALRPQAVPSSHLIAIDGGGEVLMNLQDGAAGLPAITGAIESRGWIYISSLFGNRFARLDKRDLRQY